MTPFQQQIAEALAATHESWCDRHCDCQGEDEAARLAPLIAEAIDRVWDQTATGEVNLDEAHAFALAALRGNA